MSFMMYIHAQALEFAHESLDLFFNRISAHVSQIFVRFTAENFINGSGDPVCDCNLGFIG
jgi:hypothetical protein